MIEMKIRLTLGLILLALGLAVDSIRPVWAEEESTDGERVDRGRLAFRTYCSNCHGEAGRGDGKMAAVLRVPPTDLSQLRHDNGGVFPAQRVFRAIDGRDEIRGHGRREMPVWGLSFRDPGRDSDQESDIRQRILDLVGFIDSIQDGSEEQR